MTPTTQRIYRSNLVARLLIFALITLPATPLWAAESGTVQLNIHHVSNWYAANNDELIIEDHKNRKYHAVLLPSCEGLTDAKTIAFATSGHNTLNSSSVIILPSGTRCPIERFSLPGADIADAPE